MKKKLALCFAVGQRFGMPTAESIACAEAGIQPPYRATRFTAELATEICRKITASRTVLSICQDIGIDEVTFYDWQRTIPSFSQAVSQARVLSAHALADRVHDLALQAASNPGERGEFAKGIQVCNGSLQWLAGKRQPNVYGDRVEHVGAGGLPLVIGGMVDLREVRQRLVKQVSEEPAATLENGGGAGGSAAATLDASGKPMDAGALEVMREPEV